MTCNPADMTISIDGGKEMPCSSKPMALTPGRHSFYGKTSYGFNTVVVEGVASQTVNGKIEVIDYETIAVEAGVSPEVIRKKSKLFKILGYTFIGVGAAVAGTGGFMTGYFYYDYVDKKKKCDDESRRNTGNNQSSCTPPDKDKYYKNYLYPGYALLAVGSAMAVTGVVLVVVDAVRIQPQLEMIESKTTSFHIDPILTPSFNGMAFTLDF